MMQEESVRHWQKGAQDALEAAELLSREEKYELALFHCHLATEKALKATWIAEHDSPDVPHTHDLVQLAEDIQKHWSEEEKTLLETMTRFVVDARYADPFRAEEYATKENVMTWIEHTKQFLSILIP